MDYPPYPEDEIRGGARSKYDVAAMIQSPADTKDNCGSRDLAQTHLNLLGRIGLIFLRRGWSAIGM
jgi:hypothetical protein